MQKEEDRVCHAEENSIRKEVGNGTVLSFVGTVLQAASIQAAAQSQQPVTRRRDHANDDTQ